MLFLHVYIYLKCRTGYLKHITEYTDKVQVQPYLKKGDDGADDADLTNRVVIVTGANSGVGKIISMYCAAKNAKVYMICRSEQRGLDAKKDIIEQTKLSNADNIQVLIADVSELAQVRRVVLEIQSKEKFVNAVVCNAGVLLNERQDTSEGNEVTFACHLLGGTYLLSSLLLPQLQQAAISDPTIGGRVVMVTSGGMYNSAIPSWDIMTCNKEKNIPYDGTMAYTYAKRGQVVLAEQWSTQYNTDGDVKFVTAHPGWTDTPAVEEAYGSQKKYLEPLREPWQGAEGISWLVSTNLNNINSGELYLDRKIQKKHLAGPFMSEGTFTKNTVEEIKTFMEHLKQTAGL